MKRNALPHVLLLAALLATACHNPVNPEEGETTAPLLIGVDILDDTGRTRGIIDADETHLNDLNIFVYDESAGLIHSSGYFTAFDNLCFDNLIEGRTYRILALANTGRKSAPGRLSEALAMKVATDDCERLAGGLPMADSRSFLFGGNGDGYTLQIHLQRLLAKYTLALDLSRMRGSIDLHSVELHNVAGRVSPWAAASQGEARDMVDGDRLSDTELDALLAGGTVRLLVPENCQGNLLEDNEDPWEKIPENIDGRQECCTYLEVRASYEHEGYSVNDLCYRFYLGEDAVSNFDVRRNTAYLVTLALTDTNTVVASSWKVERGGVVDLRSILFDRSRDTLLQNDLILRSLVRTPSAFGYRLVPGEGFTEAGLSVTDNGDGTFRVHSGSIPGHSATGRLWAESWDGAKRGCCDITVMNWDTLLIVHNTRHVMWPGDTARLTATMFYENDGSIRDITADTQWSVSVSSAAWFVGSTVGQDTVKLYGDHYGSVRVRADYRKWNNSADAVVSTHVGAGCSGPDTLLVANGSTVTFDCYIRFASGDTLHDINEFYWGFSSGEFYLWYDWDLPYGTFLAINPGTEKMEFPLKRDGSVQAVKYVTVVEE